jgi:hypothetical protein
MIQSTFLQNPILSELLHKLFQERAVDYVCQFSTRLYLSQLLIDNLGKYVTSFRKYHDILHIPMHTFTSKVSIHPVVQACPEQKLNENKLKLVYK